MENRNGDRSTSPDATNDVMCDIARGFLRTASSDVIRDIGEQSTDSLMQAARDVLQSRSAANVLMSAMPSESLREFLKNPDPLVGVIAREVVDRLVRVVDQEIIDRRNATDGIALRGEKREDVLSSVFLTTNNGVPSEEQISDIKELLDGWNDALFALDSDVAVRRITGDDIFRKVKQCESAEDVDPARIMAEIATQHINTCLIAAQCPPHIIRAEQQGSDVMLKGLDGFPWESFTIRIDPSEYGMTRALIQAGAACIADSVACAQVFVDVSQRLGNRRIDHQTVADSFKDAVLDAVIADGGDHGIFDQVIRAQDGRAILVSNDGELQVRALKSNGSQEPVFEVVSEFHPMSDEREQDDVKMCTPDRTSQLER